MDIKVLSVNKQKGFNCLIFVEAVSGVRENSVKTKEDVEAFISDNRNNLLRTCSATLNVTIK